MRKETINRYFHIVWKNVIEIGGALFLNLRPTHAEIDRMAKEYSDVSFLGFIGAVDCIKMH